MREILIYESILILVYWLMICRVKYTLKRRHEATDLIFTYIKTTIDNGTYQNGWSQSKYENFMIGYIRYMFSIHIWGKYSAIKPEYRKLFPNEFKQNQ